MIFTSLSREDIIRKYLEIEKELDRVKKEKEALEKELRKYKNPNTPPSAHPHLKPSVNPSTPGRKRGAPFGHNGVTRQRKPKGVLRHILQKECPNCGSRRISVLRQQHQQQEELPLEIQPLIIDVVRDVCRCNECNLKFIARDGITPIQGRFGVNLMVLVIFLKFIIRGVLRKTTKFLDASFAMKLAPASVHAIIERVAKAGEVEYAVLKSKIRAARLLYADETSFRVLGKTWWVWVFRSDTDLLLIIRKSRGNNVIQEILGKEYSGTVVCDCWRAYDFLSNAQLQRCWAHLLRKSKELKGVPGRHFNAKLKRLFEEIIEFNTIERTQVEREQEYVRLTNQLEKFIKYYSKYDDCKAVVKYIGFHLENWFICVKVAGVQPTNNYAEQAIRETVLVRKIIGAFRSEKGTETYETLASLITTWQMQKKDVKAELTRMLKANLC